MIKDWVICKKLVTQRLKNEIMAKQFQFLKRLKKTWLNIIILTVISCIIIFIGDIWIITYYWRYPSYLKAVESLMSETSLKWNINGSGQFLELVTHSNKMPHAKHNLVLIYPHGDVAI